MKTPLRKAAATSLLASSAFAGPLVARQVGWDNLVLWTLMPLVGAVVFAVLGVGRERVKPQLRFATLLADLDFWFFCFFAAVTFGCFVGFAIYLGTFFTAGYSVGGSEADLLSVICLATALIFWPLGTRVARRFGGVQALFIVHALLGIVLLGLSALPALSWTILLLLLAMAFVGLANGCFLELLPRRFPGMPTGAAAFIGATGGLGGVLLALLLDVARHYTESFAGGLMVLSMLALFSAVTLINVSVAWDGIFLPSLAPQEKPAS